MEWRTVPARIKHAGGCARQAAAQGEGAAAVAIKRAPAQHIIASHRQVARRRADRACALGERAGYFNTCRRGQGQAGVKVYIFPIISGSDVNFGDTAGGVIFCIIDGILDFGKACDAPTRA